MNFRTPSLTVSNSLEPPPIALSSIDQLEQRFSALYALTQENQHVFASPLGPFGRGARAAFLPRFVFFGPNTTDESWRLAFLAGFDRRDLRSAHALAGLIEYLGRHAHDGYGLNLSFFPLIDVVGAMFQTQSRQLASVDWRQPAEPEIALLEKDARASGFHGYIRIETAPPGEDMIGLRMRAPSGVAAAPDVELVSSDDFESFPVRFERGNPREAPADGPLSIADDLSVQPFELTLRIPAVWADEIYQSAVTFILSRFILRYRAFQAYGQHL